MKKHEIQLGRDYEHKDQKIKIITVRIGGANSYTWHRSDDKEVSSFDAPNGCYQDKESAYAAAIRSVPLAGESPRLQAGEHVND